MRANGKAFHLPCKMVVQCRTCKHCKPIHSKAFREFMCHYEGRIGHLRVQYICRKQHGRTMRSKNVPCSQNHLDLVSSVMFFAAGTPCRFLQTHNSFMSGANTQSVSGFIPCNGANCWAKSLLRLKARLSHGHGTQSALHGKFMKKLAKTTF
jgi:hypothetical protein